MKQSYKSRLLTCLAAWIFLWPTLAFAAPFAPGNMVVARVGDGSAVLNGDATAVFLDEYTPAGVLVQTIDLPTSLSATNRVLTASGVVPSELNLTRSADGRYLVLTGYGAAPGEPAVAATAAINVARVIGRIAADGTLDTSTSVGDAFSGVSIRGAATVDGLSFYAVGANSGVCYVSFGSFANTPLNTAPANIRAVNIFDGNLYISAASSPNIGISQVGTGLPTTAGQAATVLPGFPGTAAGSSPYAFYLADLSPAVPGPDVVYVADDRTNGSGGIQKWSLVAGSWVLNGTIGGSNTAALRGLNGRTTGAAVALVASGNGGLFFVADNAGYNAAPSTATLPSAVATAATNTAFRGVAFAPQTPAPLIAGFTPGSGPVGTTVTVTGTNFTGATGATLNGLAVANFMVMSATSVMFDVPAGATSGPIAVTTPGGTATSTGTFTVTVPVAVPVLTSLTPSTQVAGGPALTLTIAGSGFTATSTASFNGVSYAAQASSTATSLVVSIPASAVATAGSFPVTVTNSAGTSNALMFTVTAPPAPTIVSFTPTSGGPGITVTITGTNFTGATAVSIGTFSVTSFTVVSATSLTFVVPGGTGSSSGLVRVVAPGGTVTSTAPFNVVSASTAARALPGLTVSPNPATDRLTVLLPQAGAATVALRDLTGRLVLAPTALATDGQLRLPASLAVGIYLLEVRQGVILAVRREEKR